MKQNIIELAVRYAVELLVDREFILLERITGGENLTAQEMAAALDQYYAKLVIPPDEAYKELDIEGGDIDGKAVYDIEFPFWTEEEGQSDLYLYLTIIEVMDNIGKTIVRDIRVP